ncbi:MAG: hypothetical protein HQL27_02655 [Candidatus Omnitrophica bacterium]|nr:hypothetical protein [Candidatus Omnitrophota bacterium]
MMQGLSNISIHQDGLATLVNGIKFKDGFINIDQGTIDKVRDKHIIIFKKVFEKPYLMNLKSIVTSHKFKANDYRDCGMGLPGNLHRIDNLPNRRFSAKFFQLFSFTLWDSDTPEEILKLMRAWGEFANKVRGFKPGSLFDPEGVGFENLTNKDFAYWLNCIHYPPTGFFGRHHTRGASDYLDDNIPFAETVLYLSTLGEDFQSGGLYIGKRGHDDSELTYVEPLLGWGDILFFINDIHHETKPVDKDKTSDLDPLKSRFVMALTGVAIKDAKAYFNVNVDKY